MIVLLEISNMCSICINQSSIHKYANTLRTQHLMNTTFYELLNLIENLVINLFKFTNIYIFI